MSGDGSKQERASGVLLHVTSLPSYGGIGDFGPAAYAFADFLASAKQRLWQVLPLSPTGYGSSPYSALSAFAGNPLLISLERLAQNGLIAWERIAGLPGHDGPADFEGATRRKLPLIEEAARNFLDHAPDDKRARFQKFCKDNISWLPDYAMFNVLRRQYNYASWNEWPAEYAQRKHDALTAALNRYGRELAVEQAIQFFFNEQWCALKTYCNERKIRILGDVAIFVSYDSADVWTHPEIFELDEERKPIRVAGVPPDYFSTPASAGAILSTNGGCYENAASTGGSRVSVALSPSTTRCDSITSAASRPTGRFPPRKKPRLTVSGSRLPATSSFNVSKRSSATCRSSPKTSA